MFSFKSHFSTKDEHQTKKKREEIEKSIRHVKFNARYFSIDEQELKSRRRKDSKICSFHNVKRNIENKKSRTSCCCEDFVEIFVKCK
jgi:hypothetical protein